MIINIFKLGYCGTILIQIIFISRLVKIIYGLQRVMLESIFFGIIL
jgi:hypothetical protein